ncbi:DUF2269 domain-containing protein [Streptomyces hygroscopicus]|uniref:hypothetical protein n=1 Tax=Streptomyces hygroscopicus TaxID=1912 RepID=UPI0007675DF8|nr:hypothetical protein [Streptomyces hygroscopicus]
MRQLTRPVRRGLLVVHVVVSVGWLGLTLGMLALGITGAVADSAEEAGAVYRSMNVLGDWLLIPLSLLSLTSGIVLSLGTPWGLARHRWVYVKFWLTLITTAATAFALRARIDAAMADVVAGRPVGPTTDLILAPSVSLGIYAFLTATSVIKPWGLTARGRRFRAIRHR